MTAPSQPAGFTDVPGTRPHHKAFPPSPGPFDERSVGGADPVEHCARVQAAAAQDYDNWRRSYPPGVSAEDRRDSAAFYAVSDGALACKAALDAARAHAKEAQDKLDAATKTQVVDRSDVAAQLAANRFWRRTERTLDSIKDTSKVVAAARDLVKNANESDLPVISEELESYLSSRSVPTGWLNAALAQRIPGADGLRADAALKAKRVAVLAQNDAGLTRAFNNGTPAPALVDPFLPSITSGTYSNGEPYSPTASN